MATKLVLLVDEPTDRWAKRILQDLWRDNWRPTLKSNYAQALDELERHDYDAIVLDMELLSQANAGDRGPSALLNRIREKDLAFLAVHSDNLGRESAIRAGAEALLRRPVAPSTLQDILESALIKKQIKPTVPTCFISYAHQDEKFARRLKHDLEEEGIDCWFAPEDLEIGAMTRQAIHKAIEKRDRLILLLSQDSIRSDWVRDEVEYALEIERRQHRRVLFPIRLDDSILSIDQDWPATVRNTRNIGDFTSWPKRGVYGKSLKRLLRDLRGEQK